MMLQALSTVLFLSLLFLQILISVGKINLNKKLFIIFNILLICILIIMAYTYEPRESNDLYRYFIRMDAIGNQTWEYVKEYGPYADTVLINFIMYIISQTGNNYLLSAITTGIIFTLIFWQGYKMIYELNFSKNNYPYSLYFIMVVSILSLALIMSGIRQNLSWSLMTLAVYYDYFKKDKKKFVTLLLYLLPLTVHVSSVIIIIIRVFTILISYAPKLVLIIFSWPIIIQLAPMFISSLPLVLQEAYEKYLIYSQVQFLSPVRTILVNLIYIILLFLVVILYRTKFIPFNKKYLVFYVTLLAFGISSITIYELNIRMLDMITLLSLPILSQLPKLQKPIENLFIFLLIFISGLLFVYQDLGGIYYRVFG